MSSYPKLIRDKIPEQISARGAKPVLRTASEDEMISLLKQKLNEEVNEFCASLIVEELADIIEVVRALANSIGSNYEALEKVRELKRQKNGGFEKRLVLERIVEASQTQ